MDRDQAQKVLNTKVQGATALLADIRKLAIEHSLTVYIPTIDVDSGSDYSSDRPTAWNSSSYDDAWASSSMSC